MRVFLSIIFLIGLTVANLAQAALQEFRLDQDRVWLTADNEPLADLLEQFAALGIHVHADPAATTTVSGTWQNMDVETVLQKIVSPYDYQLDWLREPGPLGEQTRLTGIRVYRKGFADVAQPLLSRREIETSPSGRRFLAREILIGFGPAASIDNLRAFLARSGGTVIHANTELGVYRIRLPAGANVLSLIDQLGHDKSIVLAEPNDVYDIQPLLPGQSGGSGAGQWIAPSGDQPIAVSVLDSGLAPNGNLNQAVISAFDATQPDSQLTTDPVGHGTLMAQLAAGLINPFNSPLGEGVPVVAVKAFMDDGSADAYTLLSAMTHAVNKSTGPISLSWGSDTPSPIIEGAVRYAMDKGRLVFAAVGNKNTGKPFYPAAYSGVIGVAASNGDQLADYSNRGAFVDLVAPGSAGGSQGTSIATAYVSHIAALYMQRNPGASAAETTAALKKAAGPTGFLTESAIQQLLNK
ncbi:MAG: hypothetical protein FJ220_03515 [Kiritimatiellaceae bacterium]|nr:hypothetical protein [Kiritimatiellaceae bacterium]